MGTEGLTLSCGVLEDDAVNRKEREASIAVVDKECRIQKRG